MCSHDQELVYFSESFFGTRGWWNVVSWGGPVLQSLDASYSQFVTHDNCGSIQSSSLISYILIVEVWELLTYSDYQYFHRDMLCKYFLSVCYLFLILLKASSQERQVFNLLKLSLHIFSLLCKDSAYPKVIKICSFVFF